VKAQVVTVSPTRTHRRVGFPHQQTCQWCNATFTPLRAGGWSLSPSSPRAAGRMSSSTTPRSCSCHRRPAGARRWRSRSRGRCDDTQEDLRFVRPRPGPPRLRLQERDQVPRVRPRRRAGPRVLRGAPSATHQGEIQVTFGPDEIVCGYQHRAVGCCAGTHHSDHTRTAGR